MNNDTYYLSIVDPPNWVPFNENEMMSMFFPFSSLVKGGQCKNQWRGYACKSTFSYAWNFGKQLELRKKNYKNTNMGLFGFFFFLSDSVAFWKKKQLEHICSHDEGRSKKLFLRNLFQKNRVWGTKKNCSLEWFCISLEHGKTWKGSNILMSSNFEHFIRCWK